MLEEGFLGPDRQFIESFLAIKSMVEEMYRDFRKQKVEMHQALNKIKKKMSLTSMTTPKERGKRKSFSRLLIAPCIIRKHL